VPVRQLASGVQVEPATPYEPNSGRNVLRALANVAIGATSFLFTCFALRLVLPFPEIDGGVSQKFRFFAAHKDEFDTLFIGSSRVYFQISPVIFDRITRESGRPTRSFNFGIGGMYLPETAYLLEQILDLKPRNLKWVFIEYDEVQTKWSPENQTSRRALYWADWKRVSLLFRKLTDGGTDPLWRPNPEKLRDIIRQQNDGKGTASLLAFYAGQLEKNYTNFSRAADVFGRFFGRDPKARRASYLGAANDGYVIRPNRMSPDKAAAYERALAAAMAEAGAHPLSNYAVEGYGQCAWEVRKIGAVPIFLSTPSTTEVGVATNDTRIPGVLMAFNDPRIYPSLFQTSARRDGQHLTKSGSEEFSRLVATNFVELARAGQIQ
jgi:hypothetical protein